MLLPHSARWSKLITKVTIRNEFLPDSLFLESLLEQCLLCQDNFIPYSLCAHCYLCTCSFQWHALILQNVGRNTQHEDQMTQRSKEPGIFSSDKRSTFFIPALIGSDKDVSFWYQSWKGVKNRHLHSYRIDRLWQNEEDTPHGGHRQAFDIDGFILFTTGDCMNLNLTDLNIPETYMWLCYLIEAIQCAHDISSHDESIPLTIGDASTQIGNIGTDLSNVLGRNVWR